VQAVVRVEPQLRNKPVGIFFGAPPLTKVFAVNHAARQLGVEAGMTKMQAEAFRGIEWRWRSFSEEVTAHAALLDCTWTISPRVQDAEKQNKDDLADTVVVDLAGCEKLSVLPTKLRPTSPVSHRMSDSMHTLPSRKLFWRRNARRRVSPGITVIPGGQESARIGALPLESLRIPSGFLETLKRWGIQTYGEFAALPELSMVERFGQEGRRWQQIAQGKDLKPLIALDFPGQFEECMELESPVELLEPLLFIVNRLLDQLCTRLRLHILAIGEVRVTLTLERNDSRSNSQSNSQNKAPLLHIRTVRLPVPAKEGKFLLKLCSWIWKRIRQLLP